MFDGMEFCVVNGSSSFTKKDIETKIAEVSLHIVSMPHYIIEMLLFIEWRYLCAEPHPQYLLCAGR